ncbi:endonuclease/exonuclease/phosphatase family protein [Streptomyces sp. NPDC000594]|uniref:endonuclease/exonuclease/phosphatase family protein n=1 Tax=Streptomyces sp. NPDC000594 TaxID=3154261 RepID=UPI00331FE75B
MGDQFVPIRRRPTVDRALSTPEVTPAPEAEPPWGGYPLKWRSRRARLVSRFGGLLLLVPTGIVVARVADTDMVTPVPQLLAFLPWLLVPAGCALVLMVLARWRFGILWAAAVLAVLGWFVRPYDTGLAEVPDGRKVARIEVLTSNVEYGQGTDALLRTVRREDPDIVFVQECNILCSRALAAEIPRADYPHRKIVEGYGADGSSLLSRYPLRDAPGIEGSLTMPAAVAEIAGQEVLLQLVHPLPPIPGMVGDWRRELRNIRDRAAAVKDSAAIVAGDFNATPDHAAFRKILDAGELRSAAILGGASRTPSWPSMVGRPLGAQIDHVLVSRDFSVDSARFLEVAGSDHRALLVRLDLHDAR